MFFPKTAKNHDGIGSGTTPNWYYYWNQTITPLGTPPPLVVYGFEAAFSMGETDVIVCDNDHREYDAPYGTKTLRGIDNFAWTVIHESQHYADARRWWGNSIATYAPHVGLSGPNDDLDGDWLPNGFEDVDGSQTYNAGDRYDLTRSLTPGQPALIDDDEEGYNCLRHRDQLGDHSKDWGNPGMQHQTIDKYDD